MYQLLTMVFLKCSQRLEVAVDVSTSETASAVTCVSEKSAQQPTDTASTKALAGSLLNYRQVSPDPVSLQRPNLPNQMHCAHAGPGRLQSERGRHVGEGALRQRLLRDRRPQAVVRLRCGAVCGQGERRQLPFVPQLGSLVSRRCRRLGVAVVAAQAHHERAAATGQVPAAAAHQCRRGRRHRQRQQAASNGSGVRSGHTRSRH